MEAQQAVPGINAEFSEAFGRGDVAAIAALYLDDSSVLAPDQPTIRGKRAITESYKETIENVGGKMTIKPV